MLLVLLAATFWTMVAGTGGLWAVPRGGAHEDDAHEDDARCQPLINNSSIVVSQTACRKSTDVGVLHGYPSLTTCC